MSIRVLIILLFLSVGSPLYARFFPYPVAKKTLDNGLDVIVIETPEFKDVLSYNMLVLAGARNEIEKGRTGLAHLFEHILFRHRWQGKVNGYDELINQIGAFNNAWTSFDVTYYHPLTFTSNMRGGASRPSLPRLEAARFTRLDFTEEIFKTEAGAVLGEYRRNASNPGLRMQERLLTLAYPRHSYGHNTIGYLADVEDMPNEYEAALDFYNTYYRPNNVVLIVSGDVKTADVYQLSENLYGKWERGDNPTIPKPGPMDGPKREHVSWDADVPPRVLYSYRMPPFSPSSVEGAIGQLLPELLSGETAELFQQLRYRKKTARSVGLYSGQYESFDSRLLQISTVLFKDQFEEKGAAYFDEVISDIEKACQDLKQFSRTENARQQLEDLKSKFRYDLLASLDSPAGIAQNFAWYYRFERDPDVLDTLLAGVEKLGPSDIDRFAGTYFTDRNQAIVTMAYGK